MVRLLLLLLVLLGALYLVRWFLTTPAETVAANIRKSLWLLIGLALIFLAVTGKLNIIFAFIGSVIPLIARHIPHLLRLLGLAKSIKSTRTEQKNHSQAHSTVAMNKQKALGILGLQKDATKNDIINAHRRLMQKMHPDKGGSEELAAQLNQAKDFLLKRYDN